MINRERAQGEKDRAEAESPHRWWSAGDGSYYMPKDGQPIPTSPHPERERERTMAG